MSRNPILDELHAVREQLLAAAGDDLHRYVEEARARALASGRPIAEPRRRRLPRVRQTPDPVSEEQPVAATTH